MRVPGWRWLALLPLLGTAILLTWNLTAIPFDEESLPELLAGLTGFLSAISFAAIGSYLAIRLPKNAVGWSMAVYGFLFAVVLFSEAAVATSSKSVQEWLSWFASWAWAVTGALVTILLPLLFPDGKLPSRRWRWVLWAV